MSEEDSFRWFMPGDPPAEGCWDWTASTQRGYGQFNMRIDGKLRMIKAHQASYRIFRGPIPAGLEILHSCDRPICVQPAHLEAGPHDRNMRQASERGLMVRGDAHYRAKLTEADVLAIRASSLTQIELGKIFNIDPSTVSNIRTRKNWKHI